jgi:MoxR-like ATPase
LKEHLSQGDAAAVRICRAVEEFTTNVQKVIVGKKDAIELVMVALLCEGHILIEDVPGTGKTMLARTTARSLGCSFKRIQCTPDLLPSDVIGLYYFNQKNGDFELRYGPIMANIVLVDEINRATPRTQSCFLECMQERQVTVDLKTISLPRPFLIMATQNPVELEGTFPLPEAQLDRFLIRIKLGYPQENEESSIISRFQQDNPLDKLSSVIQADELLELQALCRRVYIEETVRNYIVNIARASREHKSIELGASPRASLGLSTAAQALAAIRGRDYVIPDDVKHLALPVLAHRLILRAESSFKEQSADGLLAEILEKVPVPVEK